MACFTHVVMLIIMSSANGNVLDEIQNVKMDIKSIEQNIDKLIDKKSQYQSEVINDESVEEIKKKNAEIVHNYLEVLPELIPDFFAVNSTSARRKMLRLTRRKLKRRNHHFQKTCGRKYTVLERYLEKQLNRIQKSAIIKYKNNCTEDDVVSNNQTSNSENKDKRGKDSNDASEVIFCTSKGDVESDGSVTMCKECIVKTDLGPRVFPRFINEVTCGSSFDDYFCFSQEGLCVENVLYVTFMYDQHEVGADRLFEWTKYKQPLRTSCSCQISRSSFFRYFL